MNWSAHLVDLEQELAGGLDYGDRKDAGPDGTPANVQWEKAMVLLARIPSAGSAARAVDRHLELDDVPTLG